MTLKEKQNCEHQDRDAIMFDKEPDITNPNFADGIPWFGTCECGKRVYELYSMEQEINEA